MRKIAEIPISAHCLCEQFLKLAFRALAFRRSDVGLTLKTSAPEFLYADESTLSCHTPNDEVPVFL